MLKASQWISAAVVGAIVGLSISGAFHLGLNNTRANATPEGYTEDTVEYCIQMMEDLKEEKILW